MGTGSVKTCAASNQYEAGNPRLVGHMALAHGRHWGERMGDGDRVGEGSSPYLSLPGPVGSTESCCTRWH
jgi:hypothetical protein